MRIVDLSAPIEPSAPDAPAFQRTSIEYVSHADGAAEIEALYQVPSDLLRDREGWTREKLTLGTHNSTHVDAPWHYNARIDGRPAETIDELPLVALLGCYAEGETLVRGAGELRVKESDRIALVAKNLRAMGAEVEEFEDGLDVPGGQKLHGATIDAGGDHRIAMAFSVAGLRANGETVIHGAESAAISFPEFFDLLDRVTDR